VLYAVFYMQLAAQLIAYPYDVDQGEGFDTWSAWTIRQGQLPYTDNDEYPYYSSNYPPVWSAVVALPLALLGPALGAGRAVSTLAALASALLIGLATGQLTSRQGRRGGPIMAGLFAAGLFLASPYVFHTTPLARVNTLALCLGLLGVSLVAQPTRLRIGLAAVALSLALFTKQTTADAAIAAVASVLLARPPRGLALGGTLAVVAVAGTAALSLATGGAFWLNVVAGNANPFDTRQLLEYAANFTAVHPLVLILAASEMSAAWRARRWAPWPIYWVAAAVGALSAGKVGAGESYFLSLIAASCVLAAVRLSALLDAAIEANTPRIGLALGGALLAQALLLSHGPLSEVTPLLADHGFQAPLLGRPPTDADRRAGDVISAEIATHAGDVLAEEVGFVVVAGKPVIGNPTHLRNLSEAGLWDPDELVAAIDRHDFALVIVSAQRFPSPVLDAIGRSYYVVQSVTVRGFAYNLFLPGGDEPSASEAEE
jgi:hypothetical protein